MMAPIDFRYADHVLRQKAFGTSIRLRIPDFSHHLPEHPPPAPSYMQQFEEHQRWKGLAEPWLSGPELERSCVKDLKSIEGAFPGIDDGRTIRASAAWFTVVCDVDDIIETMTTDAASELVKACNKAFDHPGSHFDGTPGTPQGQAERMSSVFAQLITCLYPPHQAQCILSASKTFLSGQFDELCATQKEKLVSFAEYIDIRERAFGMMPILTMLEYYCLGGNGSGELEKLKLEIVHMAILQNDAVGIEKDLRQGNGSNSIFIMASQAGRAIRSKEDMIASGDILKGLSAEHDGRVRAALNTWVELQTSTAGEIKASNMFIYICQSHLLWTASADRYVADNF